MFQPTLNVTAPSLLLAAATSIFLVTSAQAAQEPAPPDILLIMPDQMRGDCLSAAGHPAVRTPHLDELAKQGTLFRRAYSTCPSCIPARYALLTGLHPKTSGVVGYKSRKLTTPTLPAMLTASGYSTVLVGRNMHLNPPNKSCGYQREILGSTYVDHDHYDHYLREQAPESGGIRKLTTKLGVTYNWWQAKPWPLTDQEHPTAWVARESEKIVADTPPARPLFLTASFYAPHPPLFPPQKYFDAYLKSKLPAPAHGQWVDWKALTPQGNRAGNRVSLEGETLRAAQAGYFGLIEHLDHQIATLIAAFKARSEKVGRPWIIIFTSDHGEMLGDHGYFRKCEPYEGSANIPFIIAGSPSLGFKLGAMCFQPVCLEDIMATLLAVAQVKHSELMDGVNLTPVLQGKAQRIRRQLQVEHAPTYGSDQAFQTLTDGRLKYIWRPAKGTEQLFDLTRDPHEMHDLAQDPSQQATLKVWRTHMIECLSNRPEGFSDGHKLITGRPYPPLQSGK